MRPARRPGAILALVLSLHPALSAAEEPPRPAAAEGTEGAAITELAPLAKARLLRSCFEVVVPRPERDSLSYERELPWDRVPFHIRNDRYVSIGTAFAVSSTELVTAFHVLDLGQELLSYPRFFIRDAEQKVYEIDQIVLAHEHRDVVRFTVKGRTFDQWLELEPAFEMNRPVFTAGNAYGEGIVVRRGELIGTLPEAIDGAWSWLKSSADVNAGNSGGPLLDAKGRVIGIVCQRKDNLSYSLPVAELVQLEPGTAVYYNKIVYGFSLFPEKSKLKPSDFEFRLPMGYRELRQEAFRKRNSTYAQDMDALFAEQKELFPRGETSLDVLYRTPTSTFLEVVYKDPNSNRWALSDVKTNGFELGDNGRLSTAMASGLLFMLIHPPDSVPYADLVERPRVAMDLVFKGLNVPRELGGEKVRITSLGDPIRSIQHRDRFGRPWRLDAWHMEFSDQIVLFCSTPTPGGLLAVLQQAESSKLETWIWDLERITDYLSVPYVGRLKDWTAYLALAPERRPEAFRDLALSYEPGQRLRLRSSWVGLEFDSRTQTLAPGDRLGLYMGFWREGEAAAWELRRVVYSEDEGENYFVWIKERRPEPGMADGYQKEWREIAQKRHPYTRTAFASDGRTDIAMVLDSFTAKGVGPEAASELHTLYMGRTGTISDKAMRKLLDLVAGGLEPVGAR